MNNFEKQFQQQKSDEESSNYKEPSIKTIKFEMPREEVLEDLEKNRIVSIDLDFTEHEKYILSILEINKNSDSFNFWGEIDSQELHLQLNSFLKDVGNNSENTVEEISELIIKIGKGLSKIFDTKHLWYEIRSSLPNNFFNTPRWHTDAKFFNPLKAYKLVFALKGSQTRFGTTTNQERFVQLSIDENKEKHGSEKDIMIRRELDLIVNEIKTSTEGKNAALYLVTGDDAFIHSEPEVNESRLFMSIIPGTEEEINEWQYRMEQKRLRKKTEI